MDGRLTLTVVTPERAVVAGALCDEVTLPGLEGEMGILPAHTPLIALLGIGLVTFRDGSKKTSVAVRGGFAEIAGDAVRVLADEAAAKDAIDAGKAGRGEGGGRGAPRGRRGRRTARRRQRRRPLRRGADLGRGVLIGAGPGVPPIIGAGGGVTEDRDPWWEHWFGEPYLALYPERDEREARTQAVFAREVLSPFAKAGRLRFLDLGCGTGRRAAALGDGLGATVGVDASLRLVGSARRLGPRLRPGALCALPESLPLASRSVGAAVSFASAFGRSDDPADDARVGRARSPGSSRRAAGSSRPSSTPSASSRASRDARKN